VAYGAWADCAVTQSALAITTAIREPKKDFKMDNVMVGLVIKILAGKYAGHLVGLRVFTEPLPL
jgi:hypothetical protein